MSQPETTRQKDSRPAMRRIGTRTYFSAGAERRLFFYLTLVMLAWGIVVRTTGG